MLIPLLFIARRRWAILVAIPLLALGVAVLVGSGSGGDAPQRYQATAFIRAEPSLRTQTQIRQDLLEVRQGRIAVAAQELLDADPDSDVDLETDLDLSAEPEPEPAVEIPLGGDLDAPTGGGAASNVRTSLDETSFVVSIIATLPDAGDAERTASAFGLAFVQEGNTAASAADDRAIEAALERRDTARNELDGFIADNAPAIDSGETPAAVALELNTLTNELNRAQGDYDQLLSEARSGDVYSMVNVSDAELAASSQLDLPTSRTLRATLALMLGLLVAASVVAVVEKLNPRIDNPQHAAELVGAPVLAMVPVVGRRRRGEIDRADPANFHGPFAEAFRSMRAHLDFRALADDLEQPPRVMVTSAVPSEGKSTATAFLALSFAEAGRPPIVVGADLRRPSVHNLFDVERTPGLSSRASTGGATVPLDEIVKHDPVTGVSVVPSGPAVNRVAGLLGDLSAITEAGRSTGRVVLVDTAPVMVANDATDFLVAVDWVVVVVRVGKSTERAVRQMMQTLRLNDAVVVGVVMVGSVESSDAKRYYYSYYATEAMSRRERRRAAKEPPSDLTPAQGDVPVSGSIDGP